MDKQLIFFLGLNRGKLSFDALPPDDFEKKYGTMPIDFDILSACREIRESEVKCIGTGGLPEWEVVLNDYNDALFALGDGVQKGHIALMDFVDATTFFSKAHFS